jgi:hypothetical protein
MKRLIGLVLLFLAILALPPGCGQETRVEDERTITTPHGETTIRETTEVEKTGEHRTDE